MADCCVLYAYEMEAAVGSVHSVTLSKPAMRAADIVAARWSLLKVAGTLTTAL